MATSTGNDSVRLGDGSIVPAAPNLWAWKQFLLAIKRKAPEVLSELEAIVNATAGQGRIAKAVLEQWGGRDGNLSSRLTDSPAPQPGRSHAPLDAPTEAALKRWSEKWGFPWEGKNAAPDLVVTAWWMRMVRTNIRLWRASSARGKSFRAGQWLLINPHREPGWTATWNATTNSFDLTWPSVTLEWHPLEETERDFCRRASIAIKQYVRTQKGVPNVAPTPQTFRARDFDAFVLEHVKRLTGRLIATELDRTEPSPLRKRNRQLARLLGLPLRRRSRGAPKKEARPRSRV